ncbi:hypothetical protein PV11_06258 [Exophiala sideris]|uniref:F-box domain-containing protein n=1 Tax=Exophiala sideris TaxID=1016849 RepID=A0A0D1VRF4_9EURO|nr:hypothetical protein PV11_06258 [Exophiala sideris]
MPDANYDSAYKRLRHGGMLSSELGFMTKRPDYNNVLIDVGELGKRVRLCLPKPCPPPKAPLASLGYLDRLSTEMQYTLFAMTPVTDLFRLRAVNSYAKNLIEQWPPCSTVIKYAPHAIQAMLATSAGELWTVPELVDVIFGTKCEYCGEHGEILQLLRLKRCCFRCLSQERELLAIRPTYAKKFMGLTDTDLEQIPHIYTVPQKHFWGYPSCAGPAFDYKAALHVARQRRHNPSTEDPSKPAKSRFTMEGIAGQGIDRFWRTSLPLAEELQSIQHSSTSSIQMRRQQPLLHLPEYELEPPETFYLQHACSVELPAIELQHVQRGDGTVTHTGKRVSGMHCAGCASYWNYHSPLPWVYHRLYRHQPGSTHTDLTKHLAHCLYARMHWIRLWNPWEINNLEDVLDLLANYRRKHWPRNQRASYEEGKKAFEEIPPLVRQLMLENQADCNAFVPRYSWPAPKDEAYDYKVWRQRQRQRQRLAEGGCRGCRRHNRLLLGQPCEPGGHQPDSLGLRQSLQRQPLFVSWAAVLVGRKEGVVGREVRLSNDKERETA